MGSSFLESKAITVLVSVLESDPGETKEESRESVRPLQDFVPCWSHGGNGRTGVWSRLIVTSSVHRVNCLSSVLCPFYSSLLATWAPATLVWGPPLSPSLTTSTLNCPTLRGPRQRPKSSTRTSALLLRRVWTSYLTAVFLSIGIIELVLNNFWNSFLNS